MAATDSRSIACLFLWQGSASWCRVSAPSAERVWLRPGRAVLVPSNCELEWCFAGGERLVAIHFAIEFPVGYDLLSDVVEIRTQTISPELLTAIAAVDAAMETAADHLCLHGLLEQVIANMLPATLDRRLALVDDAFAADLARRIARPPDAQYRVADLAHYLGIGADALAKRFERHLGKGPKQWLDERLRTDRRWQRFAHPFNHPGSDR